MEKIKFNDGTSIKLHQISSTDTQLTFSVLDDDKAGLEAILKDEEKTSIIQLVLVNEESLDEKVVKAYSGYTGLSQMKTEYGVITNTDYETPDSSTTSGFAEEKHDITTSILNKPTLIESEIAKLKESQAIQDGAIDDLGEAVSEIAG